MSTGVTLVGTSLLAVLLAGYLAQKYLPAPTPKIVGIDLGTTFSSVGVYHAGSGVVEVLEDQRGRKSFPSVVAFLPNGSVLVSFDAVESDLAIYDAKRFIGKNFTQQELQQEVSRYPFEVKLVGDKAVFNVAFGNGTRLIRPEEVGAQLIAHMVRMAQKRLNVAISKAVISVPAEFDDLQRNATIRAAQLAGIEVLRMINEPTAAALAYGLHKKVGVDHVIIVDLGGGTLDVSILLIQGGMFITRAMAGNNHLGGQDFTERLYSHVLNTLEGDEPIRDPHDLHLLRQAVEEAKLTLTYRESVETTVELKSRGPTVLKLDRPTFERLNADLFRRILRPIEAALSDVELNRSDIDEIVLVGGSTRIPAIRRLIAEFFDGKEPNVGVDPELAVVTGVAVQAGVISGGWPLQVSATELPARLRKIHVYN